MTNVRDYFKKKEQKEETGQRINYKEKIKSHKFTIFYRGVLALVLIAVVVMIFKVQWQNKIYTESVVVSSVEVNTQQNATLIPFSGYILSYSKDGANCIDAKGTAIWNETFEMQNPMIDVCQNVAAIGDYNGRSIYVMNTNGLMGQITTNKPLRDFCVSANGVVAAVLDDADVTLIYLYDTQGQELVHFRTTMQESGYPFDVSISPDGKLVCVSYLFVDSGEMKSSVAFYNFGEVGQNTTDNYVSGYDYLDVVVGYTRFMDSKTVFAVSDDRIMFFAGAEKPVSIAECLLNEDVQKIYYSDSYVGLVFISADSSNRYRLDVYTKSGQLTGSIDFDIEYSDIVFAQEQIIIYNESECRIYNMSGVQKYAGLFDKAVYTLIPTSTAYKYIVVTPDSIDTVELK